MNPALRSKRLAEEGRAFLHPLLFEIVRNPGIHFVDDCPRPFRQHIGRRLEAELELYHGLIAQRRRAHVQPVGEDRKSTRLNSSHEWISYAVFCLKKKKR